ncbi:MAG: hypothetical protein U9N60_06255 [Thermodesulfobacteriota bacterium]|nr:hypothetical protein [Thermodesulfobacteriota bacterium]
MRFFYGIGAYSCTLLMMEANISFVPATIISMAITGGFALLVVCPGNALRAFSFLHRRPIS